MTDLPVTPSLGHTQAHSHIYGHQGTSALAAAAPVAHWGDFNAEK